MTYQVLEDLRIKAGGHQIELSPGQTVILSPERAVDLMDAGKIRPATPEEIMVSHMKRLWKLDMARDSSALHEPILAASEKIVKAFDDGDYTGFMAILSDLEDLYGQCPPDPRIGTV